MDFDYQGEFESLTSQTRELLFWKQASDPDDFREQSRINHALELCMYRLKRFACEKTLTNSDITHLILIETVFPEIKFRVPVEFQRHVSCPCASQAEKIEANKRATAYAELIAEHMAPSEIAQDMVESIPLERAPFEEDLSISDEDMGLEYSLEVGVHLPRPIDPILPSGDYDLDEVGDHIQHYDYGEGFNSSIETKAEDLISAEVIFEHHGKKFVSEQIKRKCLRRRFRGKVDVISKTLTIVRRGGAELTTLKMKPYGLALLSPEVKNLPMVGTIELREIFKIVKWWTTKYYVPLAASDLAERAFSSIPQPSLLDFCKLMI